MFNKKYFEQIIKNQEEIIGLLKEEKQKNIKIEDKEKKRKLYTVPELAQELGVKRSYIDNVLSSLNRKKLKKNKKTMYGSINGKHTLFITPQGKEMIIKKIEKRNFVGGMEDK